MRNTKAIDWMAIQNEYIAGELGYRPLAEKHGVSFSTLKARAIREGWASARENYHKDVSKMVQKNLSESASSEYSHQISMIQKASGSLTNIINALAQTMVAQMNSALHDDAPETERVKMMRTISRDLKYLVATVKDLADITRTVFDIPDVVHQHQMQIADQKLALEREKIATDEGDNEVLVRFENEPTEEYCR